MKICQLLSIYSRIDYGPKWENVHRILRQKMEWSRRFFPASDGSSKLQASSFFLRRTISNGYESNIHFGSNDQLTIDPNYWDTFHCCRCAILVQTIPRRKDQIWIWPILTRRGFPVVPCITVGTQCINTLHTCLSSFCLLIIQIQVDQHLLNLF